MKLYIPYYYYYYYMIYIRQFRGSSRRRWLQHYTTEFMWPVCISWLVWPTTSPLIHCQLCTKRAYNVRWRAIHRYDALFDTPWLYSQRAISYSVNLTFPNTDPHPITVQVVDPTSLWITTPWTDADGKWK